MVKDPAHSSIWTASLNRVTESYRAAISGDGESFSPATEPSRVEIQDWKNLGGWNDDWPQRCIA